MSLTYSTQSFETFSHILYTPTNEVIASGSLADFNGAGHLARATKNGLPLWSYYYSIDYFSLYYPLTFFSNVKFTDFVLTADGGVVVAGTVERFFQDANTQYKKNLALLARIDKYGAVEWTRTYLSSRGTPDLSFSNLYQTSDGDLIAYMSIDYGPSLVVTDYSYNRVMRLSANGEIKWSTHLATGVHDASGRGIFFRRGLTQLANKNIVVGDAVYQTERGTGAFRMTDGHLHFFSLDYTTGKISWESSYPYIFPAADATFVPDINYVSELPDGRLSFSTSLYLTTSTQSSLAKRPVSIITDNKGVVQKLVSYSSSSGNALKLVDVAVRQAGNRDVLFQDGTISVVMSIDPDANVVSSKGYSNILPANCFTVGDRGYGVLFSDNQSKKFNLLLSDAEGRVDCADVPANIMAETLPVVNGNPGAVATFIDVITAANFRNYFSDDGYPLKKRDEYPIARNITCEEPINCCTDLIDSAGVVSLCEGSTYRLPDNSEVKDSGTYYVVYKTARGCDSIIYYTISVDKNLTQFTLGEDTCFTDRPSVVLRATPGYTNYTWMGIASALDTFRVYSPGLYWVKVSNVCGSKTDSLAIYDQCDFPVFMPDAFTPNGDNLNDYFGIPPQNKNRLIELKIYDRWGQLVFETKTKARKWDGRSKNRELATGVFIYNLVMEGLSGKKITHKGKVLLVR